MSATPEQLDYFLQNLSAVAVRPLLDGAQEAPAFSVWKENRTCILFSEVQILLHFSGGNQNVSELRAGRNGYVWMNIAVCMSKTWAPPRSIQTTRSDLKCVLW